MNCCPAFDNAARRGSIRGSIVQQLDVRLVLHDHHEGCAYSMSILFCPFCGIPLREVQPAGDAYERVAE